MSLPSISTLDDITSFTHTVTPYLHQLSLAHILPLLRCEISLTEWYLSTNPLITALTFALFVSGVVLVLSEITRNYSQVDRLWSILPTVYIAHFTIFTHLNGLNAERLDTLLMFSCLWSIRLTFNYWRKGGYNIGHEDYRWEILRKYINPVAFLPFNIVFISLSQNLLLFAIAATPAYTLLLSSLLPSIPPWSTPDLVLSRALVVTLIAEAFADQQQWAFQCAKASYRATGILPPKFEQEDLDRGFVVTGLWSFSRHPNFAAEQTIWVLVYLWSCWVADAMWYWSAVGAVAYCLLFQASTAFTEWVTAGKYGEYSEYQMRVNKFVPGWSAFFGGDEVVEAGKKDS